MRFRDVTLGVSSLAVQAARNPVNFASKVALRATGRPLTRGIHVGNEFLKSEWDVPIHPSTAGTFNGRVLHVLTNSLPHSGGGYAIRSHNIIRAQQASGLQASAITRLGYPISVGKIPVEAVEYVDDVRYARSLPLVFPFGLQNQVRLQAQNIVAEASKQRVSVLHTTTPWTNAAATSLAAKIMDIPWVYEVRGEPEATWAAGQPRQSEPEKSRFYLASRSKEQEAMDASAAVITLSETSAVSLAQRGINRPIAIAPNAVEDDWAEKRLSSEEAKSRLNLPRRRYAGAVSSIVDYEGFDDLIRALHYLPDDVAVLLVGDGAGLTALRETVREERLDNRVVFAGRQPPESIALWYSAIDVFVVPRKDRPVARTVTPMKTLQAQAFGIPIVASDLPALREVTRGEGRYISPECPAEIASAVCSALREDRPEPPTLTTWSKNAEEYSALYQSL